MPDSPPPASNSGLSAAEVKERLAKYGYNEVPEKKENTLVRFAKRFWGLSPWMMEITMALTWAIGKYVDTALIAFLLFFNAILGFFQEGKANAALEFLKEKLTVNARAKRDGNWITIPAKELVPGDLVRLRAGDFVPADLKILEGVADVDQSSLTGESFIVPKSPGDIIYSGTILQRGEVTGTVSATGVNTYFGRTVQLVQIAKPRLRMEEVTAKVVWWMLVLIVILLIAVGIVSVLKGQNIMDILPIAVLLLISAVPIALPTMFLISLALGSLQLARVGVLTTRLNSVENAATMDVLCADKTGTITLNRLEVADTLPVGGHSADEAILYGALASRAANRDPIDMAFLDAARDRGISLDGYVRREFTPFDPLTRRTIAVIEKDGKEFTVTKGALGTILGKCRNCDVEFSPEDKDFELAMVKKGYRALAVALGDSPDSLSLLGLVFLYDKPRTDSPALIRKLEELGIEVKMLTGDALPIALETARKVDLGDKVIAFEEMRKKEYKESIKVIEKSDGFAEIYPEDKFFIVESMQKAGHVVGMTGDGVNDTPALKQADVGIAVSGAVDVAKKAAGIVLTGEGLSGIVDLVTNGRRIYRRIHIWVFNKIVKTFQTNVFIILAFIVTGQAIVSIFTMILMMFLFDFVILSISTDNVPYSQKPDVWDITGLVKVAIPLGLLIMAESFAMLFLGYRYFDLSTPDRLYTYVFDILLFMALLDVLIVRERRHFWRSMPGTVLLVSIVGDILLVAAISIFGIPGMAAISYPAVLTILVLSIIATFAVNDIVKVALIKLLWRPD